MVEHRTGILAVEVEIGMIGEIDYSRGVGRGTETQCQLVGVAPGVLGRHNEIARITFLAILGAIDHHHRIVANGTCVPYLIHESFGAAVKGVGPVVYGKSVFLAFECEMTARYTVGKASWHLAHTRTVGYPRRRVLISESHVGHLARFVGNYD